MGYKPGLLSTFGDVLAMQQGGWFCHYCGKPIIKRINHNMANSATVDHMHPISKGGSNSLRNMVLACHPCNAEKGNMLYQDFIRRIRKRKHRK